MPRQNITPIKLEEGEIVETLDCSTKFPAPQLVPEHRKREMIELANAEKPKLTKSTAIVEEGGIRVGAQLPLEQGKRQKKNRKTGCGRRDSSEKAIGSTSSFKRGWR